MAMLNARTLRPAVQRRSAAPARRSAVVVRAAAPQLPRWPEMYQYLVQSGLSSVAPKDASSLVASGKWVLVDVRPPPAYEKSHPEGAVNVPIYVPLQPGSDLGKLFKLVALKSQGVDPMDPNPDFGEQVKAVAAGKEGVIFTCEAGGTMKPSVNFPAGKPSRSLQAAYRGISESLAKNVTHLERGVYGWFQADLPIVGEYVPELGRTPMAAPEPTLAVLTQERGYEMSPDDKPVPEKKKGWF